FDVVGREERGEGRGYERWIRGELERLKQEGRRLGALIIEPVVLGAGGMLLVDPLFQCTLVKVVRENPQLFGEPTECPADGQTWTGLPVIFDEVFTGLYRLGRFSAASFLGVDADISVHAKLLTGGLVPLSVTLGSESIFKAFESDDKSDALLHGHSYTAHAVGCQVAVESIKEMQKMEARGDWAWAQTTPATTPGAQDTVWSVWGSEFILGLPALSGGMIGGVWAVGTVLAIRMASADGSQGYKGSAALALHQALLQEPDGGDGMRWNIHTRVLGNTLYLMTGQKTTEETVRAVESRLRDAVLKVRAATVAQA
ncbi:pyridoxal phosphate-dependent transferase, partial [Staphylotrichum tortipilum]